MVLRWNLTSMNNLLRVLLMSLIPAVTTPAAAGRLRPRPPELRMSAGAVRINLLPHREQKRHSGALYQFTVSNGEGFWKLFQQFFKRDGSDGCFHADNCTTLKYRIKTGWTLRAAPIPASVF